jgi:transposase
LASDIEVNPTRGRSSPMRRRAYRGIPVGKVNREKVCEAVRGKGVVFGVDVGKERMAGGVWVVDEGVVVNVVWRHPEETVEVIELVVGLPASRVEVVMEPSGTYGDAFRYQCVRRGLAVYRVSPKRSHDAAEAYDGVPSWHDVKSAGVVAKLHVDGASHPWRERTERERDLSSVVDMMAVYELQEHNNLNRLEARLARYWPELPGIVKLNGSTLAAVLSAYGGPRGVAAAGEEARELMRRVGGSFLDERAIEAVSGSAKTTIGVPMQGSEAEALRELVDEILRCRAAKRAAQGRVRALTRGDASLRQLSAVIGVRAAAVMVARGLDPRHYDGPASLIKGAGLNLKEKSSGKDKGLLKITKRGPGEFRYYAYLAVLRLTQRDPVVGAWYRAKVARDGGAYKNKAVVAVMRKVVGSLWYVARGAAFDAHKLFDSRRLNRAVDG